MVAQREVKPVVVELESHPFVGGRPREFGFLLKPGDKFVCAHQRLQDLAGSGTVKALSYSFDLWIQGHPNPRRHHGWEPSAHGGRHSNCYVFKHTDGSRVYGFKIHPDASPRAQVCCLVHFTEKHQDETERAILDELERLYARVEIRAAVNQYWNLMSAKEAER